MAITKEDILNAVADMSVMDVCDLVSMMEEKLVYLQLQLLLLLVQQLKKLKKKKLNSMLF